MALSHESQITCLRETLRLLVEAKGRDVAEARQRALFVLDNPDACTQVTEEYQREQKRLLEDVEAFLDTPEQGDTAPLQRRIDRIMRLRGASSKPKTCVRDLRGKTS